QCAVFVEGPLEPSGLRRAVERLVAHHEILRTTYRRPPGRKLPLQVILDAPSVRWRVDEVEAQTDELASAAGREAERLLREESEAPLDLESGPILSVAAARFSPERHVVVLTLPAVAGDRETLRLLLRELWPDGGLAGQASEAAVEYADYCEWQTELLQGEDADAVAGRAFWTARSSLAAALPFSSSPRTSPDFSGDLQTTRPDVLPVDAVRTACAALRATPREFLLACWQILLRRLSGEEAIGVRVVHPGRKFPELTRAIGRFARALPIEARLDEDLTFADAVRSASEALTEAEGWAEYLDSGSAAGAAGSGSSSGFEMVELLPPWESGPVRVSLLGEEGFVEVFPLAIRCSTGPEELTFRWRHDPEIFASSDIERLTGQFRTLVAGAAARPDAAVLELPILTAAERNQVVVLWNQTRREARLRPVHELFEERARERPNRLAVTAPDRGVSYGELDARANRLARYLRERGVRPGVRVGLACDRSADMVLGILAIAKAGGAYLPLNPEHPGVRQQHQLAESEVRLLLTSASGSGTLAEFGGETLRLDRDGHLFETRDASALEPLAGPDDLVYVLYTSGSTGVPKGVAIRHSSLSNYTRFITERLLGIVPGGEPLVFATVSTVAADLGNTAIFPALTSGGCLRVIDGATAMDGERLAGQFARDPVDVLKIVPSHLAALLPAGAAVLPRKFLIFGGEVLPWDLVRRVESAGTGCRIVNHYGPTETTVGSLTRSIDRGQPAGPSRTVPIGRPISNTEVFVLDKAGAPVPVGTPGEIHIGGAGLAVGYVNQPAETSRRFIPHPFSDIPGERVYRTGDRGRWLPEGEIEYLGRVDDQVKIRGFRIEPAEVSAAIAAHSAVRECFVAALGDTPADVRLVAYWVPNAGAAVSPEELRAFSRERLPEAMVPSAFVSLRQFPLTGNGKIDRRALPSPEAAATERAYTEPRTPTEATVARVWAEVLRVPRVGAEDNFFDLGGHSLLLTQVVARLRNVLANDLPIRWLFEAQTVAALAEKIDAAERADVVRILDELEGSPEGGAERMGNPR
ncbi:MAG TPA: amino acid adenylation domain-containing protein, partial [Thermoanaerobaculia bacterium]|nr:amino acid adenylation domain-containing protein [Thermoanaerobaculia bacterium]